MTTYPNIILGIDPGVKNLGVAKVDMAEKKVLYATTIDCNPGYIYVLNEITKHFSDILSIGLEKPFFTPLTLANNIRTLEVIGIIKLAIQLHNFNNPESSALLTELSPASIKKEITGNGRADKKEVAIAVKNIFNHDSYNSHEADAVAIAYTTYEFNRRLHNNK